MKTPTGYIGAGFDSHCSETLRSCQRMIETHAPRILREHNQANGLAMALTGQERKKLFELGPERGGLAWRDPEASALAIVRVEPKREPKQFRPEAVAPHIRDKVAAGLSAGKRYKDIRDECVVSLGFISRMATELGLRRRASAELQPNTRLKRSAIRREESRARSVAAEKLREEIYCAFDRCERRSDIGKKHGIPPGNMRVRWLRYCRIGGPRRHLNTAAMAA